MSEQFHEMLLLKLVPLGSDPVLFECCSFRDRIFSPDITMWGFLSQVLSDDQSCQAAVAHVIAHFANQGKKIQSPNTAAYSKARSRLRETLISAIRVRPEFLSLFIFNDVYYGKC